jgi:uncharacterized membrane protein (DUF4010 family)
MSFEEIFLGFLIALAAGALIGLERQQDKATQLRPSIGGVRTFPLIALVGALSAFLAQTLGVWPILGALLVVGGFLTVSYYKDRGRNITPGITTPVAALITFFLGVLALLPNIPLDTIHRYLLIVASAAVVMALLSFKEPLHQAITHVSNDDIYATAKFVILALVVLPLLPNRTFGPLDVLNPFHIGLMVVLIAGISFLGYIATRLVGPHKGLASTGLLGGLVSSTAVTVSLAAQVKKSPNLINPGAMAILASSSTMFARVLMIVGILQMGLLPPLLGSLGAMTIVGYGIVLVMYLKAGPAPPDGAYVDHRNPFELISALTFGLLYTAVLFIAKAAQTYLGDHGLYASSILAGTTDVDAITLSVIQFHSEGLNSWTAAAAITLAAMTNTLVKTMLTAWLGGWDLAKQVAPGMLLILMVGGIVVLVLGV